MATFCRICGVEISYKRTPNDHWMPCNAITGEPHFCVVNGKKTRKSGLDYCTKCGRPVFLLRGKLFDYSALDVHVCKKADVTRYSKYVAKQQKKKTQMPAKTGKLAIIGKGGVSSGSSRTLKMSHIKKDGQLLQVGRPLMKSGQKRRKRGAQ